MKIRYNVSKWIMWWYAGRVLYPYMLFRDSKQDVDDVLFRHELEHVYQIQDMGVFWFYLKYLLWLLVRGYKRHPYEVRSEKVENYKLTPKERKMKDDS